MTYKEVAEKAGSPNAARAVGSVMSKNQGEQDCKAFFQAFFAKNSSFFS